MSELAMTGTEARLGRGWDRVMIYAVIAAGMAAGVRYAQVFWYMTGIMVWLLVRASRRAFPEPVVAESGQSAEASNQFPPRVAFAVQRAVAELPSGDARKLLGAVMRQGRPLFGATTSNFDPSKDDESRLHAADLVVASCDTALELARLDALIESGGRAEKPAGPSDLDARYVAARATFAKRLTDAATALGELYASGIEHGTPASDRVAELAAELKSDAAARVAAQTEVDELMK
jgi:hypothetical protein